MAHGGPDWGVSAPKKTVYLLEDMAELAARLGSIVTFDRRGDVILLDSFEYTTLQITNYSSGTGAGIAQSSVHFRNSGYSVKCTSGDAAGDQAGFRKWLPYAVLGKLGYEIHFVASTAFTYFYLKFEVFTGAKLVDARVRWHCTNHTLEIYDHNAVWQSIATDLKHGFYTHLFIPIKMVIDFDNEYYTRFLLANRSFDLSAYKPRSTTNTSDPLIRISFWGINAAAGNSSLYADDVIVTQNEP